MSVRMAVRSSSGTNPSEKLRFTSLYNFMACVAIGQILLCLFYVFWASWILATIYAARIPMFGFWQRSLLKTATGHLALQCVPHERCLQRRNQFFPSGIPDLHG